MVTCTHGKTSKWFSWYAFDFQEVNASWILRVITKVTTTPPPPSLIHNVRDIIQITESELKEIIAEDARRDISNCTPKPILDFIIPLVHHENSVSNLFVYDEKYSVGLIRVRTPRCCPDAIIGDNTPWPLNRRGCFSEKVGNWEDPCIEPSTEDQRADQRFPSRLIFVKCVPCGMGRVDSAYSGSLELFHYFFPSSFRRRSLPVSQALWPVNPCLFVYVILIKRARVQRATPKNKSFEDTCALVGYCCYALTRKKKKG